MQQEQSTGRDLAASVKTMNQGFGDGGFIVGFDNDPATIFKSQINFIQKTGIVTAMVGLLNAPRGTRLYQRMKKENRLLKDDFSGDNMDSSLNFVPKMNREALLSGYRSVLNTIYSPKHYYERIKVLLREYKPKSKPGLSQIHFHHFMGLSTHCGFWGGREDLCVFLRRLASPAVYSMLALWLLTVTFSVRKYVKTLPKK
jgi:radical SAM superfamily enzyme YgiQ (UPF0313 family)